jgi:hypothetical protein
MTKRTRVRGLAPWNPQKKTLVLLAQIDDVLREYRTHLPLTLRQIFYRLVAQYDYPKDANAYERLAEATNRARRSERISWNAIRDDGGTRMGGGGYSDKADFLHSVRFTARLYRRDRMEGQPRNLELWCEAAGMVPQLSRIAHEYGIPVCSSGGFESSTERHQAAKRFVEEYEENRRTTLLMHVGDHDPSGESLFNVLEEDITAMCSDLGRDDVVEFFRVAITREQIRVYGLPEQERKQTDKRGEWSGGTTQAEALTPTQLEDEVRAAIEAWIDPDALDRIRAVEEAERKDLLAFIDRALATEGKSDG